MERERIGKKRDLNPMVQIRGETKKQEAVYRAAFSSPNYLTCYGGKFYRVGNDQQFRRVHYYICFNRCPLGIDGRYKCGAWLHWLEEVCEGVEPIIRLHRIKPGSAGDILYQHHRRS